MENTPLRKLLVVDDDYDTLTIARYCLEGLSNVELKFAQSGEETIKVALDFFPDLILLDVMMPKMDGVETFKALKALKSLEKTPVVFFTANAQREEIRKFFDLGVIDVVIKPFDPMVFAKTVQNIWEKYNQNH